MTEIVINGNTSYLDNLLEVDQINDFTLSELRILRNTIFAKYGYKFTSGDLIHHFSQFPWYEGNKISVENELTSIDWENIRLIQILENYYPLKIDCVFNFQYNGIYKLDNNFSITPIYTYNDSNIVAPWAASYDHYIQLDDFLFFHFDGKKALLYDYITGFYYDMWDLGMEDVISIYYESKNTLVVNGSGILYNPPRRGPFSFTVNFPNDRFDDEIIGRTVYIPEETRAREFIYQGITRITYNSIENYFRQGYGYEIEYVKEHLFTAFDKNIIVILENRCLLEYEGYIYNYGIPEGLWVNIIYNNIYNIYFIMVIHGGWATR
jgi:hypothetical protein